MRLKLKNFRGSFPITYIEPSENELLWLFNNLEKTEKVRWKSSFMGDCFKCEKQVNYQTCRVSTEKITDVPVSDWDECRGIEIAMCPKCKNWTAGDY